MAKTMINIKTDKEVKRNAQKAAERLGLSLSDVMNASLRNFIRTQEVWISAVPHMTPELERLLGPVEGDIKARRNLSTELETPDAVARYLATL